MISPYLVKLREGVILEAVPADFVPLVAALLLAAGVYLMRERRRWRTRVDPPRPDVTLLEAWELWRAGRAKSPDLRFADLEHARQAGVEAQVAGDLAALAGAVDDLGTLRREIVRAATTAIYFEAIAAPDDAIAAPTVRWLVLREYARLKFDDAVEDDWFHQYVSIAGPYIQEKVRLAREFLAEGNAGARRLMEIYDELLRELAERLLRSPRKQRYVPPDLRTYNSV